MSTTPSPVDGPAPLILLIGSPGDLDDHKLRKIALLAIANLTSGLRGERSVSRAEALTAEVVLSEWYRRGTARMIERDSVRRDR